MFLKCTQISCHKPHKKFYPANPNGDLDVFAVKYVTASTISDKFFIQQTLVGNEIENTLNLFVEEKVSIDV